MKWKFEKMHTNFRYVVMTFLVLSLTLGSFELFARFYAYLYHPYQSYQYGFDKKYFVGTHAKTKLPLIVIAGDSTMNRGIFPELLEKRMKEKGIDVKVINVAVTGSIPQINSRLIQAMLDKKIIPSLVLLDYDPTFTNANSDYIEMIEHGNQYSQELDHSYMGRCLLKGDKSFEGKLICKIEKYSFFIRYRSLLRYHLIKFSSTLFNLPKFDEETSAKTIGNNLQNSHAGWSPSATIATESSLNADLEERVNFLHRRGPWSENYKYTWAGFQQYFDLTQKHNIPLVLVWLPHFKPGYDPYFYKSPYTHEWFLNQFKSIETRYDNVLTLNLNTLNDDYIYFKDYRHLNVVGAIKVTEELAEKLSQEPFLSIILNSKSKKS